MKTTKIQMKRLAAAVIVIGLSGQTVANDATHCYEELNSEQGTLCGQNDSAKVTYKNVCNQSVEFRICFKKVSGRSSCGLETLKPGQKSFAWACNGTTGKYTVEARTEDSDLRFSDD